MNNAQVFFAMAALFISVIAGLAATVKWYMDARFNHIDRQMGFLMDHAFNHGVRIAALEAKTEK